jgi:outer membrane factor, OMF family
VGPGGLFDFSRIDYAQSKLEQGRLTDAKLHDEVSRQVVQTFESAHSASHQLALTKKSVALAEQSLQLSQGRKDFGVATVLEVIQAQKDLTDARGAYLRSLTQYAELQYALVQAVAESESNKRAIPRAVSLFAWPARQKQHGLYCCEL